MSNPPTQDESWGGAAGLFRRRQTQPDSGIDMTPMIDCVFLLLIFFLVTALPDAQTAVELPNARHGKGADPETSVIITMAHRGPARPPLVYLADGKVGAPLADDPDAQAAAVRSAVQQGRRQGKPNVLLKAEKTVHYRDVSRVAAAAAEPGARLFLAVFEVD